MNKRIDMDEMDLARGCADTMMANDDCSQTLGIEITGISPGAATSQMSVVQGMLNSHDICHGGMIFTLADSCFAYACNSRNQSTVAMSCDIDFMRPAHLGDRLTAHCREVCLDRKNGIYDVVVKNQDDLVIAHFRGKSRAIRGKVAEPAE